MQEPLQEVVKSRLEMYKSITKDHDGSKNLYKKEVKPHMETYKSITNDHDLRKMCFVGYFACKL